MSNFMFRPAKRENVNLIIGIAGGTGSGKTYSALRVATGMAGEKRFCVIDTEAGRAKHYADQFSFDHGDLMPPFRPQSYIDAIMAADKAGYPVVVVDSMSHVWAGDGGVLDWQDEEHKKSNYKDSHKMVSWIKPKMGHKKMVAKLLQVRAQLILCFRAEEKIEMKKRNGKMEVLVKEGPTGVNGWFPVSEKNLPYELTASFLLLADKPGVPHPIKLEEQHRALFPAGKVIDEECGRRILEWAKGGTPAVASRESTPAVTPATPTPLPSALGQGKLTDVQINRLTEKGVEYGLAPAQMLLLARSVLGDRIRSSGDLTPPDYVKLMNEFDKVKSSKGTYVIGPGENGGLRFLEAKGAF